MASHAIASELTKSKIGHGASAGTRRRDHLFYTAMALAMSVGVFGGFARTYYAASYFHSAALPLWLHIHGAVFTAWILFYIAQNLLVLTGRVSWHRQIGIVGAFLAPAVFFLGIAVTVRQVRQGRFFPFPDAASDLLVSIVQMLVFAAFVGVGLALRRKPETHKRLILMSTQLFFFPAFGRLLQGVNGTTLLLALSFYIAGPIYDLITRRSVHVGYRWGVPLLILSMPPFTVMASHAEAWRRIAGWIVS